MDKVLEPPFVSVIMAAYNSENYIQEAIDSVIKQTFLNWELIIVDDGSTDSTAEIILKNKNLDDRIKSFYQDNAKQSKARNLGISHSKGRYIAILDSDDIIFPERFAKQVRFLEANSHVILCGSSFRLMGSDRIVECPEYHDNIKISLLKGNCIAHSSVLIRKQVLVELSTIYDISKEPSEDYDLYVRLLEKGKLHNLQDVLLDYRTHCNQLSKQKNDIQVRHACEVRRNLFNFLEFDLLPNEEAVFTKVLNNGIGINFKDICDFKKLQIKLLSSNTNSFFDPIGFKKEIVDLEKIIVKRCFITNSTFMPKTYLEYLKVKQQLHFKLTVKEEFKLALKSLVFFQARSF